MISRNLTKRLEQLEGRILPPREIHLLRVVYAEGPESPPVGGYTVGLRSLDAESEAPASRAEWGICLKR
jgi:hypothetical protein